MNLYKDDILFCTVLTILILCCVSLNLFDKALRYGCNGN